MSIISYDTPAYMADLYGPTYKLDSSVGNLKADVDADFCDVGKGQQNKQDEYDEDPYPFGFANFSGATWGSGIRRRLPGSQGCDIFNNCPICGK